MNKKIFFLFLSIGSIISGINVLCLSYRSINLTPLAIENIEALSRRENSGNYLVDDWEEDYFLEKRNGKLIYVVCGGRNCFPEAGNEENCLQSYYEYEEER